LAESSFQTYIGSSSTFMLVQNDFEGWGFIAPSPFVDFFIELVVVFLEGALFLCNNKKILLIEE